MSFSFSFGLGELFGPNRDVTNPDDIDALLAVRDREVEDYLSAPLSSRGVIDTGQATANQTGISAITFLTGLSVTGRAVYGRQYEIRAQFEITQTVGTDVWIVKLLRTSDTPDTQLQRVTGSNGGTQAETHDLFWTGNTETGVPTYALSLELATGTGTLGLSASATAPAQISFADVGST